MDELRSLYAATSSVSAVLVLKLHWLRFDAEHSALCTLTPHALSLLVRNHSLRHRLHTHSISV